VSAVRRMMRVLLAVGLAVVVAGLALRTYLNRPLEDRLTPDESVSIADLSRPLTRPSFLACPPGYCAAADMPSPIFNMPWDQLREYWKEMIAQTPAILEVSEFEHRRGGPRRSPFPERLESLRQLAADRRRADRDRPDRSLACCLLPVAFPVSCPRRDAAIAIGAARLSGADPDRAHVLDALLDGAPRYAFRRHSRARCV